MNNEECSPTAKVFTNAAALTLGLAITPTASEAYSTRDARTLVCMAASCRRAVASLRRHRTKPVPSPTSASFISVETAVTVGLTISQNGMSAEATGIYCGGCGQRQMILARVKRLAEADDATFVLEELRAWAGARLEDYLHLGVIVRETKPQATGGEVVQR